MQTIFLDFETYFDNEYSLRKMTPVEYVLDPRFECNGCAIKIGIDGEPFWLDGDQLQAFFDGLDPKVTSMVTHNALFDMCIVAWRYGFIPKMMVDTLGISRALFGHVLRRVSLEAVSAHLDLGAKGKTLLKVVGMNLAAIKSAGLYDEYVAYAKDDVTKCAGIYEKTVLAGKFPPSEMVIMDMVLRCAIEPMFHLDRALLAEHLAAVRAQKELMLAKAMIFGADGKGDIMSNDRFAALLQGVGVEPPMKTSPVTGRQTYAFAKTDPGFLELQEHPDPAVQALIAARLGLKSTLEETRTERMLTISTLTWPGKGQVALMPIPLRFSGAHTHRLSGDWSLNLQNLPTRGGSNALRRALIAPPGYKVVAPDASQIEARIVAWICGQNDLVEQFRNKEDVYSNFAGDIFGHKVEPKKFPEHKSKRFVGKTGILQLGFGCGWEKFQWSVEILSANTETPMKLDDPESQRVVNTYRSRYPMIQGGWKFLQYEALPAIALGPSGNMGFGPCLFEKQAILLPNGLRLHYHDLSQTGTEWRFTHGGTPKRIYGGALLENIVQALARIIVMDAAVRIQKRACRFSLQVHDELVYVVPDRYVEAVKTIALEEMSRPPVWAPELPLASEADVGGSYGDAK